MNTESALDNIAAIITRFNKAKNDCLLGVDDVFDKFKNGETDQQFKECLVAVAKAIAADNVPIAMTVLSTYRTRKVVPKKERKTPNECYVLAEKLARIANERRKRDVPKSILAKWATTVNMMMIHDDITYAEIDDALNWYQQNWRGEYMPVVESAVSLRSKFGKIRNAMARTGWTKEQQNCASCDYLRRGHCDGKRQDCKSYKKAEN